MIIDCISDLHGIKPILDGGDLLLIAGDLTARDTEPEYQEFIYWLNKQKYDKKILIAGNHDGEVQQNSGIFKFADCEYLCDSGTEYKGYKIWGSPWTSQFPGLNPKCCAFTRPFIQSLKDRWDLIPDDVDILITHTPPLGLLDQLYPEHNANVGDMDLMEALHFRIKPKIHVFGHIHEHGGKKIVFKRPGNGTENNTICINASIVNERYQPVNKAIRIKLVERSVIQVEENEKDLQ